MTTTVAVGCAAGAFDERELAWTKLLVSEEEAEEEENAAEDSDELEDVSAATTAAPRPEPLAAPPRVPSGSRARTWGGIARGGGESRTRMWEEAAASIAVAEVDADEGAPAETSIRRK